MEKYRDGEKGSANPGRQARLETGEWWTVSEGNDSFLQLVTTGKWVVIRLWITEASRHKPRHTFAR